MVKLLVMVLGKSNRLRLIYLIAYASPLLALNVLQWWIKRKTCLECHLPFDVGDWVGGGVTGNTGRGDTWGRGRLGQSFGLYGVVGDPDGNRQICVFKALGRLVFKTSILTFCWGYKFGQDPTWKHVLEEWKSRHLGIWILKVHRIPIILGFGHQNTNGMPLLLIVFKKKYWMLLWLNCSTTFILFKKKMQLTVLWR